MALPAANVLGNPATTTSEFQLAIEAQRQYLEDLDFSTISGSLTAGQIPNLAASKITTGVFDADRIPDLDTLGGALTDAQLGRAAQQSGHVRAGNMQLVNGADMADAIFQITALPTNSTWESIGKTGSGKDNIWSAMDGLPASARVLLVNLRVDISSISTALPYITVRVCSDDVTTPGLDVITLYRLEMEPHSAGQDFIYEALCFIPMSSSQAFKMSYYRDNVTVNYVQMFYRGFIED